MLRALYDYGMRRQLALYGLEGRFDAILGRGDIYAGSKEAIGREYLQGSGVPAEATVMIGDSLSSDMQGGRNAGIPTCLYGRTEPISPLCDYAVADLLELPALLAPL